MGLVVKENALETLIKAIEAVNAGEVWLDRRMIANVLNTRARSTSAEQRRDEERIATLTEREKELIVLVGQGLKNKEIADRLSISEATVRHHLTSILAKLDVQNRLAQQYK
jgi:two-component system nitrate/nitrite response regulator NarL